LRVLGIDLGTSLSSAAVIEEGKAVPLRIGTAASLLIGDSYCMPTSVFIEENGTVLLGQAADNSRMKNPGRYRKEFKRDLGTSEPYHIGDMELFPEDLYRELLKYFRVSAEERLGGKVERVVVTHPANYAGYKKELIKKAALMSGFSEVELIDEPTAAAIYYSNKEKVEIGEKILVYDLGGGTFDVSLIEKTVSGFKPLTTPLGIERCGGIDFQRKIYENIISEYNDEIRPVVSSGTIGGRQFSFMLEAESIKIKHHLSISKKAEAVINLPGTFEFKTYEITREKFETMIKDDIEATCAKVEAIVNNAKIKMEQIDKILLVGGSSRIPYIEEMISKITGKIVSKDADTELVVALGAAIYAARNDCDKTDRGKTPEALINDSSEYKTKDGQVTKDEPGKEKVKDECKVEEMRIIEPDIPFPERYKDFFKNSSFSDSQIVAIEIGSTFSRIACVSEGRPKIITNSEGEKELPTAICFYNGRCITGKWAKNIGITTGTLVYTDVNNLIRLGRKVSIDGCNYPAELLYAFMIQRLKEDAENAIKKSVKQIILIVPMYLSYKAKAKIRQTVRLAGVETVRILDNCTANSISYAYLNPQEKSNLLLCNIGGESTETAIINIKKGEVKVSHKLETVLSGGNDYTRTIVNYAINNFKRSTGIDLTGDRKTRENIYTSAEVCIAELYTSFTTNMHLTNITNSNYAVKDLILHIKKSEYAVMTASMTNEIASSCVLGGGFQNSISKVLLIGEGASTPLIKERISTLTGKEVIIANNSQCFGALGGAIQAGIITSEICNISIVDCVNSSIGIKNNQGKREVLIPRSTTIPARVTKVVGKLPSMELVIAEGDDDEVVEEDILQAIDLMEIISKTDAEWKLELTMEITEYGEIVIKLKNIKDNREISIKI
jgi:molecular chaperone DnaK (HSP70)